MRGLSAEQRVLALRFAHVAMPAHVSDCEPWEWQGDVWRRLFTVREWQVAAVLITVSGEQNNRGDVTHWMYVGGEDQFTGSDRQPLLEALIEAGALLDSLSCSVTERADG